MLNSYKVPLQVPSVSQNGAHTTIPEPLDPLASSVALPDLGQGLFPIAAKNIQQRITLLAGLMTWNPQDPRPNERFSAGVSIKKRARRPA